ncbi:MAG: crossover junction endodeoxyribonuclease RuvC [Deltaproteobacteria bacterium]|nr:crossover junction endodeoxyribonuclease RuvC [Deltaproteobacteria bacterium]MBW1909118.1 crossover junction endodeoxyribonuclease RuvC [Deltaproteobacteria bacterium]MBW2033184.1 crossover junction endodeoxyribonuclease RuvC [Deltaproteobacteria bacterium]MBW2115013.1 crossover junction endodeoxyribonuclease RuvC [Deltaproteobacteria bacterium]MBW2167880.1 crossover junction endodeoxyribonuclease RuvC [Deltaproteobacteria bacterium]
MIVLGIDPGSRVTGYGLVEKKDNEMTCIHSGHIAPSGRIPFYDRIHFIFQVMVEILEQYRPQEMAIEDLFYAKNVKSSLKLGHARGAVLIAAVHCGVKIFEYTPLEIKKSIVGYGRATKEQVRSMVQVILKLKDIPNLDTSDALATAICHLNWTRFEAITGQVN